MDKLISVIVPIYKVEKYLDKCVESIVNQTYKNLEIILVDDGSPDNCPGMCDEWAKKDKRIRIIHKKNGGLSSARNAGLDMCAGDYIMFVDSDDYCAVSICEELLKLLLKHDADFAMCETQIFDENHPIKFLENQSNTSVEVFSDQSVIEQLYYTDFKYLVSAWGKLYKKSLFEKIRYPIGRLHEDVFVLAELLHKTHRFVHVSSCLYYYLQHASSITGSRSEKDIKDMYDAFVACNDILNREYPQNFARNEKLLFSMIRTLCIEVYKYKSLYKITFNLYKGNYKKSRKHDFKNWLFYHFNWLYMFLLKVKN